MLELKNIYKSFYQNNKPIPILEDLNLRVEEKDTLAIVGPSGVGKTTLLSIMAGLEKPNSGEVILDGVNITNKSEADLSDMRNKKIGFIFQSFALIPSFTALENVLLPSEIAKTYQKDKAMQLLADMGLEKRLDHYPSQLSGGEKQRVAIARALINNPDIIFADEPTGSIDSKTSQVIIDLLLSQIKNQNGTLVLITHNLDLAQSIGNVMKLENGTLSPV